MNVDIAKSLMTGVINSMTQEFSLPLRKAESDHEQAKLLIDYLGRLENLLDKANHMSVNHSDLQESVIRVTKEVEKLLINI
jgi:hypothetical protein